MMGKIFVNHLLGQFSRGYAKVASCPKMSAPIPFFNMRKLLKYFVRCTPLYPAHYLGWRHIGRRRDQYMNVILTDHSPQYLNLKVFTRLTNQIAHTVRKFSLQDLIAILGYPDKMVLNLKFCVAALAIFHDNTIKQPLA